jgi:hypothetical protein
VEVVGSSPINPTTKTLDFIEKIEGLFYVSLYIQHFAPNFAPCCELSMRFIGAGICLVNKNAMNLESLLLRIIDIFNPSSAYLNGVCEQMKKERKSPARLR